MVVYGEFIEPKGAPDADNLIEEGASRRVKRGLLLLTCGVYGNVIRFLFR
jgi:4-aminobutyrate aminotransferase